MQDRIIFLDEGLLESAVGRGWLWRVVGSRPVAGVPRAVVVGRGVILGLEHPHPLWGRQKVSPLQAARS